MPPSDPPEMLLTELDASALFQTISSSFLELLHNAVRRRLTNLPSLCRQCKRSSTNNLRPVNGCEHAKLAILFSGGIDSAVLTVLADRILPINEPIDLLNVAFFSDVSSPPADRQTGNTGSYSCVAKERSSPPTGLQALTELNPVRQWNFVKVMDSFVSIGPSLIHSRRST